MTFEQCLETNKGLIYKMLKKYVTFDTEELYQAGTIGLWRAYNTYDETKGAFSTHAYYLIQSEITLCLRTQVPMFDKSAGTLVPLKTLDFDLGSGETLGSMIPDEKISTEDRVVKKMFLDYIVTHPCLTKVEKEAMYERYVKGLTKKALAQKLQRTEQAMGARVTSALKKLRVRLVDEGVCC